MRLIFTALATIGCSAAVASCSTAPVQETRSPKAAEQLSRALAGRTQQPAVSCLPSYRTTQQQVIDDWTILYRDGSTVYVQNPRGGCRGLGFGNYSLVHRLHGTHQLCEGEISQIVDLHTGIGAGACVFGPFIPYTKVANR